MSNRYLSRVSNINSLRGFISTIARAARLSRPRSGTGDPPRRRYRRSPTKRRQRQTMESAAAITAKSEKDAFPLVREVLSRANFERKALNGLYIPSKVVPGRTYRFKLNQKIDVLEDGTNIGYLCVGTDGRVLDPVEEAICLYLNLVLDEAGLLRTANLRALPTRMISLWPRE